MKTIRQVLAHCCDVHLDEADVGQHFSEEAFCEAWLPLAHLDGALEEMRALAWRAAGLIAKRWGEEPAGHVEETVISAAWGHATPPVGLIGADIVAVREAGWPAADGLERRLTNSLVGATALLDAVDRQDRPSTPTRAGAIRGKSRRPGSALLRSHPAP